MMLKSSVTTSGVHPSIYYAIGVAEVVYRTHGLRLVVTSLTDSHADRPSSLHNKGLAVDLRTNNIPADLLRTVHGGLVNILNPLGYDVVLESDHIHLEFDPKAGETWQTLA